MKRAFLLAALLSSGCYEQHTTLTPGNVNFYWQFRDHSNAIVGDYTANNPGCVDATVTTVRIFIDNGFNDVDCVGSNGVPGVQLQTFAPGGRVAAIVQIHQQQVERTLAQAFEHRVGRADELGLVTLACEEPPERLEDVGLIVGDEDFRRGPRAGGNHAAIHAWDEAGTSGVPCVPGEKCS